MTGIHHVALPIRREEVEVEIAFWALLGFSVVEPPPSLRERATWLQAPDATQIHLLYVDESAPRPGHIAIVAPAFDATLTALATAGHPTHPRTPHWGAARAYVHSPSGHLVELMAAPPPPPG